MTFDDLDRELPNGFHDARIFRIGVDYGARTATLDMSFWTGDQDCSNRDEYRDGTLQISGLLYLSIEPPDPAYPFMQSGSALYVSGYPEDGEAFPPGSALVAVMPADATGYRFFVNDWNSFIHIAASDVKLSWADA